MAKTGHKYITLARTKNGDYFMVRFSRGTVSSTTVYNNIVEHQKSFAVKKYPSPEDALAAAIAYRDKTAEKYKKDLKHNYNHRRYRQTARWDGTTGVVGVGYEFKENRSPSVYASWSITLPDGTRKQTRRSRVFLNDAERLEALEWATKLRKRMEKKHYKGAINKPQ